MSGVDGSEPPDHGDVSAPTCPHCRELADEIADLKSRLTAAKSEPCARPPFALEAVRLETRSWAEGWVLRPSPSQRAWMTATPFSYQCLPLVIANQWGWQVLCPTDVQVTWDGSPRPDGLRVDLDPQYTLAVMSRFGSGIVTFKLPWLFRTPPGWDLYAKGPSNRWKTNCVALEGVIETWWLKFPFTLNWKLVEPGTVTFARGESLGQLVPVPHTTFQDSSARETPVQAVDPELVAELLRWNEERRRIADEPFTFHLRYRRANEIEEHLVKVPVPPVAPAGDGVS